MNKPNLKVVGLSVAGAALIVGGGSAALNHYNQYQTKQDQHKQSLENQVKADQANLKLVTTAAQTLQAECEKGKVAYAKLPVSVQKTTPAPTCTAPTVQ